ncbi:uncharacterized protein LOC128746482 [Synchiropus splendidus]|uniref:uncharacterized protein LOC128746482 n=1 Tax=Synchiropus splendidus TaxID=270530 RepID=UPI00237E1455|nr:uncharacterized protein LOC128746482 [Synchiropus splendidus]
MAGLELLFLLVAAVDSQSTTSAGQHFLLVYPENIAYYYTVPPAHAVYITALHGDTTVHIKHTYKSDDVRTLAAGVVEHVRLDQRLELGNTEISDNVVRIFSNKDILVQSIGGKSNSVQSSLVLPSDKLGKRYIVPQLSRFTGTNHQLDNTVATERGPYRAVVINTGEANNVTLEGLGQTTELAPYKALQIFLDPGTDLQAVSADKPVVVLLSHTCGMKEDCSCEFIYTALEPESSVPHTFLVPPFLADGAENDSLVILTDSSSTKISTYDSDSPKLSVTGSAIFYRPGLLLTLIPESSFASCFVIRGYENLENFGVIVVHKAQTDGVRLGKDSLGSPDWQQISGTDYVSAAISLAADKNVLWHSSSIMGVYHIAITTDQSVFGNQAPILSRIPDYRGCIVNPEGFEIGTEPDGWRESVAYCKNKQHELVSFPDAEFRQHLHKRISEEKGRDLQRVWIGMRLRLLSGDFYWLNKEPLTEMDWCEGEPQYEKGHCVAMNVEDFGWTTEHCCMEANPVCYKEPVLLPI